MQQKPPCVIQISLSSHNKSRNSWKTHDLVIFRKPYNGSNKDKNYIVYGMSSKTYDNTNWQAFALLEMGFT